ncbi:DNA polymerase IV [Desulfothermobacter acidiphilus]|uniref:DNA polymerase IV n=1 Tax=Desulfothermobacter acidiphilus TaxID=1938353 RepID=UPI003F8958F1
MQEILLCDLDAFFAAVEQRDNPELRGRPVIIGGAPEGRGVVATCSYEARRFGIRSAMPLKQALRLCSEAVLLPVDLPRYRRAASEVLALYRRFTPRIEVVSIDEAYLGVPPGEGLSIARAIKEEVLRKLQLPLSIGVSVNKLLAKIACNLSKPRGLRALWPEEVEDILWPLPVEVLPGIGPRTRELLELRGIKTVRDLALAPIYLLKEILGKEAFRFKEYSQGIDRRGLVFSRPPLSFSKERTFAQDVHRPEVLQGALMLLAEELGFRLRRNGYLARNITLKLRFADFRTVARSRSLREGTNRDSVIYRVAMELFQEFSASPPWRLVGIQVAGLDRLQQLSWLGDVDEERERLLALVLDSLRSRYGRPVVHRASGLKGILLSEEE